MKKALSLILSAVLAASVLAGCGSSKEGSSTSSESGAAETNTLTIALGSDIVSLDPAFAYDFTTNQVVNQITEGLLTFDQNNQLIPLLASEWKEVDPTTYVYTVRNDVTFSDGTAMTMDDVLFSLERTMNESTGSFLQWMYGAVDTIEQTGDWELTVKLKQPSASWQYVLATTAGHIVSKAYYEEHADDFGSTTGGMLGTGAYVFESWKSGQEIVLQKNPNYWNTDIQAEIDTLVFKIIVEDTTRVTALQTGQVDFCAEPPLDMMDTLTSDPNLTVSSVETFGLTYLAFNTQREPMSDVNVRKAIYHALDMNSIQQNIIKSAGEPGTLLPHGKALYTIEPERWTAYAAEKPAYTYDLDTAKDYMSKSAYPDGFSCTLLTNDSSLRYSMALAVQEALKELNINADIIKVTSDEHTNYQFGGVFDANGKRDYDMIIAGWEADYPDVAGNIEPLYTSSNAGEGGSNAAAYVNQTVNELILEQSALTDPTLRNDKLFEALDIITEDIPYIFFEYPIKQVVINKKYTGFTMNASWLWSLRFQEIHKAA